MSKESRELTELEIASIKHWQRLGTLERMKGNLRPLQGNYPRVAPALGNIIAILSIERMRVDADYAKWKEEYLATHPEAAAKYRAQNKKR